MLDQRHGYLPSVQVRPGDLEISQRTIERQRAMQSDRDIKPSDLADKSWPS
ncbi:MAG TPA: hypothetical protein VFQ44_14620 [Streptosporangiaceae bacterium]|nr:hypothetical protein [Streptosporangiaceae bacterium]